MVLLGLCMINQSIKWFAYGWCMMSQPVVCLAGKSYKRVIPCGLQKRTVDIHKHMGVQGGLQGVNFWFELKPPLPPIFPTASEACTFSLHNYLLQLLMVVGQSITCLGGRKEMNPMYYSINMKTWKRYGDHKMQRNLKRESAVAAILQSRMEVSYCASKISL